MCTKKPNSTSLKNVTNMTFNKYAKNICKTFPLSRNVLECLLVIEKKLLEEIFVTKGLISMYKTFLNHDNSDFYLLIEL